MTEDTEKHWFSLAQKAVSLLRETIDLLPESTDQTELQSTLEEAEYSLKEARTADAVDIGFDVCNCAYPRPLMFRLKGEDKVECEKCGRQNDVNWETKGGGSY